MRRTRQNDVHLTQQLRLDFLSYFSHIHTNILLSSLVVCFSSFFFFQFNVLFLVLLATFFAFLLSHCSYYQSTRALDDPHSFFRSYFYTDRHTIRSRFFPCKIYMCNCCSSIPRYKTQGKRREKERKTHTRTTRKRKDLKKA